MELHLNIAPELVERIASALERIEQHLSALIPTIRGNEQDAPYGAEFFSRATDAEARKQEQADYFESIGHGEEYRKWIETQAVASQAPRAVPQDQD